MKIKYSTEGIYIDGLFFSKDEIILGINNEIIKEGNWKLVRIKWSRRANDIKEYFLCNNIEKLKELVIGKEVYFGEIEGKHSDVYGTIEEDEIKTEDFKQSESVFLKNNPSGKTYDHSFISYLIYDADEMEGEYDNYEEFSNELKSIVYNY